MQPESIDLIRAANAAWRLANTNAMEAGHALQITTGTRDDYATRLAYSLAEESRSYVLEARQCIREADMIKAAS